MGRVGTQVVFDALFVTDVNEYAAEDSGMAPFVYGNEQTALEHVLQEADGLQADRLSTGVRSADEQDALPAVQFDVQWHHFLSVLGKREL